LGGKIIDRWPKGSHGREYDIDFIIDLIDSSIDII
jgi:hypothetical protein